MTAADHHFLSRLVASVLALAACSPSANSSDVPPIPAIITLVPHTPAPSLTFPEPPQDTSTYLVTFVADGDTVMLENGESVRYLGIDAPETHHPVQGIECFGEEATQRNRELVEGKRVVLEQDESDRDAFGRLLRYVYVDGSFVSAILVQEGYAFSSYWPPDTAHYQLLLDLELEAEREQRGLWSSCPR